MANTFSKINLHLIFAVKGRESILSAHIQPRVHAYMASALRDMGHFPISIGGCDNHVHILVDMSPKQSVSDMVRELKTATTKFINSNHLIPFLFAWQRGFSCFSYSTSHIEQVKQYIEHQYEHHKNTTLREEIIMIYNRMGKEYDPQYIFDED